jgi:tetratricopeptide (TPR) repeat protein
MVFRQRPERYSRASDADTFPREVSEDETHRTRRWQKLGRAGEIDPIQAMRMAIADIRATPRDQEARRHLRALAAEQNTWEQLALLLEDEARAASRRPEVQAAFLEELADVHENLDQPLETISAMEAVVELDPDNVEHHDRLAWLYRRAGAWQKAAEAFERVAGLARDDRARAALRAAGTLYRDNGRLEQAAAVYRAIVDRRPTDLDVWKALEETLTKLQRWRDVAEVRGEIAARATGVEKAVLLRGQARALEQAGDPTAAAALVAQASRHAPDNVSGLVDYADVLARGGQAREAADIIAARVDEAIDRGASTDDVAALRLRLVAILDDDLDDHAGAAIVLRDLLAAAPEYLPGLERLASTAARAGDRRAHAEALMRYAAAQPDSQSRLAMTIEAAKRAREAGEHRAAVAALEHLAEELPHDRELAQELEDARTALVVDRALAEAAAGESAAGERRLRTILGSRPYSPDAALALADLLAAQQRPDEAAEILRETLEAAPDHASLERLAELVKRTGELVTDRDEAHQLLHEAHRLDRKSLDITLALGESCFHRKLWREAALHLGNLAEHPDATKHAATVATGLVHAGLAEVRALRPANALRHYEAAVKLDPLCARAWHELAELAMEKGDTATAADRLEREAEATTEPRDRLRLYDALGDLALEVLGDPVRAERCWATVASITTPEHVAMLHKLLVVQRKRGAGAERGETCAWLADLESDDGARKVFLEESIDAFTASGELRRARDLAASLVLRYPLDLNTVAVGSRAALAAGDADNSARWLRKALTTWDTNGDRGMGDPRRADLWRRLGDAERARNNQAGALTAYQRAVATSTESDAALAARRGIVELASTTGRLESSSLIALVEAEQEPNDVIKVARQAAEAGAIEDARAGFELARALGVALTTGDERFLNANRLKPMASDEAYGASLDEADRRAIVDDEADGVIGELLELIGEAIALICPDARTGLERADLASARRIAAGTSSATAALYPQIANALGGPQTLLYAVERGQDLALLLSAPPVVVIGPRLAKMRATSQSDADTVVDSELRFRLGRVVELARTRRLLAAGTGPAQFKRFVIGLFQAFGRANLDPDSSAISEGERLKSAIPLLLRRRISERLAGVELGQVDPAAYLAACERAADRSGMLACGDIGVAIAYSGGVARARHLVRLAASPRYLSARKRLRSRINRSE